jgi:hypothetical protein
LLQNKPSVVVQAAQVSHNGVKVHNALAKFHKAMGISMGGSAVFWRPVLEVHGRKSVCRRTNDSQWIVASNGQVRHVRQKSEVGMFTQKTLGMVKTLHSLERMWV